MKTVSIYNTSTMETTTTTHRTDDRSEAIKLAIKKMCGPRARFISDGLSRESWPTLYGTIGVQVNAQGDISIQTPLLRIDVE